MERYENKISNIKDGIARKQEHILKVDDEIHDLQQSLHKYEELQKRLPERHQFPWDVDEKDSLKNALDKFIKNMAENHKRTSVAIAARINVEKWLRDYRGDY